MEPVPEDLGIYPPTGLTQEAKDTLLVVYDNAGEKLNADTTIRWLMAAVFIPLITALLTLIVLPNIAERSGLAAGGAGTGLFFIACWFGLEKVMLSWINYWIGRMKHGEKLLNPSMRVFSGGEYEHQFGSRVITTNRLLMLIILMLAITFSVFTFLSLNQRYRWIPTALLWFQSPVTAEKKAEKDIGELRKELQQLQQKMGLLEQRLQSLQKQPPIPAPSRRGKKGAER